VDGDFVFLMFVFVFWLVRGGGWHRKELVFFEGNEERYKNFYWFEGFVPVLVPNREKTNSRKNKFG